MSLLLRFTIICNRYLNDSFILTYYTLHFKESIIIILYKHGGNKNYTNPKNNRPINLFNIIGKIMKTILATKINYMVTTHSLPPKIHFGSR